MAVLIQIEVDGKGVFTYPGLVQADLSVSGYTFCDLNTTDYMTHCSQVSFLFYSIKKYDYLLLQYVHVMSMYVLSMRCCIYCLICQMVGHALELHTTVKVAGARFGEKEDSSGPNYYLFDGVGYIILKHHVCLHPS